jgi:hypothetical protein
MEGSARFKQLLETSMINFMKTHASRAGDCNFSFVDVASECSALSSSCLNNGALLPPEVPLGPDDDCSWIHVDPAELDELMQSKSNTGATKGKSNSADAKISREKLEQIAAAVDSDDGSDSSSETGEFSESDRVRAQLRSEGASKMGSIISGLTSFVDRISAFDGADTGADELPMDDTVEFNAMLAFAKLGDAVGIEEEDLFAAMQQRGWGTVDELLTLKALTDMNMNAGDDIFDGSDDDSCGSSSAEEQHDDHAPDSSGFNASDLARCGSSIADLQTAMDNELMNKACDQRAVVAGQQSSSRDHDDATTDDESDSNLEPVDIDTNLLENIMESIRAQHGEAGPAGALLGLLNVAPPVEDRASQQNRAV